VAVSKNYNETDWTDMKDTIWPIDTAFIVDNQRVIENRTNSSLSSYLLSSFLWWSVLQSVPITTKVVSSNPTNDEVYSIQHYVIKFVSDLRQVGGFLRVLGFPLPIKLTTKEMMIRDKKREMNWFCSQLPVGYRRWMLYRLVRSYQTLSHNVVSSTPRH
jgi:hypothetical protein